MLFGDVAGTPGFVAGPLVRISIMRVVSCQLFDHSTNQGERLLTTVYNRTHLPGGTIQICACAINAPSKIIFVVLVF